MLEDFLRETFYMRAHFRDGLAIIRRLFFCANYPKAIPDEIAYRTRITMFLLHGHFSLPSPSSDLPYAPHPMDVGIDR